MKRYFKKSLSVLVIVLILTFFAGCKQYNYNLEKYITLGNYKGVEVEGVSLIATNDEITNKINSLLSGFATDKEVTDRAVRQGDTVTVNATAYCDSKEVESLKKTGYSFVVGSFKIVKGFSEGVIGTELNKEKSISVTFPDDYSDETLRGKNVVYKVTVTKIMESVLPELTDDFIKTNSGYDTLEAYRAYVKEELEKEKKENYDSDRANAIWAKIKEESVVLKIPQKEVKQYKKHIWKTIEVYAESMDLTLDGLLEEQGLTKAEMEEMVTENATNSVKEELYVNAIAQKEKIDISDDEYMKFAESQIANYGCSTIEEFENMYGEEIIYQTLLYNKVTQFLIDNCVIK